MEENQGTFGMVSESVGKELSAGVVFGVENKDARSVIAADSLKISWIAIRIE